MMASDNAAAETLAYHFGKKLAAAGMGGGNPMGAFVGQMNGLAQRLGMRNTRFTNAHGLGASGQGGYSTASDVARLTIMGLRTPGLSFYSSQNERTLAVIRGGAPRPVLVRNTNELLGRAGVDGGKTGTTASAGPCLMATAPRAATVTKRADGSTVVVPNRLVVVVLGANDRFNQAYTLLQQGWPAYERWRAAGSPTAAGTALGITTP
jgi:D-alanyl-D-alanine carboxypeptidase (penicillin-binding protein 5/6)